MNIPVPPPNFGQIILAALSGQRPLPTYDPRIPQAPLGPTTGDFAPGQSPFHLPVGVPSQNTPTYVAGTPTPGVGVGGPAAAPDEDTPQGIVYGYRNGQTFYDTPAGRIGYASAPQAGVHVVGPPLVSAQPIRGRYPLVRQINPPRGSRSRGIPASAIRAAVLAALARRHG